MSDQIKYTVEWTISDGKLGEFRRLADITADFVRVNEPDMLGYQWFFNSDHSKCYLMESAPDCRTMLEHYQKIGVILPAFLKIAEITRFEVYGNVSEQDMQSVAPYGAICYGFYDGFVR
jgi:hypothetical protein